MEDTEARGSQEEQEGEAPKRVRLSDEDKQEDKIVESEMADTDVAQSGSAHGVAAPGHKRKREEDDDRCRGMDSDWITKVQSLGGMSSRMSRVDPEIDTWAKKINDEKYNSYEHSV